jgi:hypothetical protein
MMKCLEYSGPYTSRNEFGTGSKGEILERKEQT